MKITFGIASLVFGVLLMLFVAVWIQIYLGILPTEVPIVLENTKEYFCALFGLIGRDFGIPFFIIASYYLFSFFFSLYHRYGKRKKDTLSPDDIKGPFVLYLRSFIADNTTVKRVSSLSDERSEEEVLVDVLSDIAPVYAIGDPNDKIMPLGASRVYVEDRHWKTTVVKLAQKAAVVVLRLGETDSFWWEVEMAAQSVPLDRILFVVPESKTFNNVATLYKILLDNGIDIKSLDVSVDKKLTGSISSFLFFAKDRKPVARSVKTPRFSRIVLSYENILRNTLAEFRAKFGLQPIRKHAVRVSRLLQAVLLLAMLCYVVPVFFNHFVELKYQMPYELLEKCVGHAEFTAKYSNKINGSNLTWAIIESARGSFWLTDEKYKFQVQTELAAIRAMSHDERKQLLGAPENPLLMIKKYVPECYMDYVNVLSEAAILAIRRPEETEDLIRAYKRKIDVIPQWMNDFCDSEMRLQDGSGTALRFANEVIKHAGDDNIVEALKVYRSLTMNISNDSTQPISLSGDGGATDM